MVDGAWAAVAEAPADPVKIEVDQNGLAWVIDVYGDIYSYTTGSAWIRQAGDAIDIGLGGDGSVWYLDPYGELKQLVPLVYERIELWKAV